MTTMSNQRRRVLRQRLLQAGFSLSDQGPEEDRVIHQWLRHDLRRPTPNWLIVLPGAIELGRLIYRTFTLAYSEAFLQPFGWGCQLVRRYLSRDWLFTDGRMEEAVLCRIRDRRLVLLEHLRGKFQNSLFAEQTFDPALLPAYLRRVARLESLKVPEAELPWNCVPLPPEIGTVHSGSDEEVDYRALADRLSAFWSKKNGFTAEHHLEGVISLGLGSLVRDEDLRRRCDALLADKLPKWEQTLIGLRRRASRLLELHEAARLRRRVCHPDQETALDRRLAELEARIQSCRERLARHPSRLRPRPGEVGDLLAGHMCSPSAVRHDRIRREIDFFRRRSRDGWAAVLADAGLPASVVSLREAIESHLDGKPPSSRMHGLNEEERGRRKQMAQIWLERAANLLHWTRAVAAGHRAVPLVTGEAADALEGWLCDVEDFYQFGILVEKGVIHALGKRHGRRLLHLLRPESNPTPNTAARISLSGREPK